MGGSGCKGCLGSYGESGRGVGGAWENELIDCAAFF